MGVERKNGLHGVCSLADNSFPFFQGFCCGGGCFKLLAGLTVDFIYLGIFLPLGVLQCMLRIHPCGDVGIGEEGNKGGWGRRREGSLVVARILRK